MAFDGANHSSEPDAGSSPAASTYDPEALKREAIRILIKNHICNCKKCQCESRRGR